MMTERLSAIWTPPLRSERPVVVAIPHAGRVVPGELRCELMPGVPADALSDPFVDLLAQGAPCAGIGVLVARLVRSYLDLNRSPFAFDRHVCAGPLPRYAEPDEPRVRAGLGVVPRLGGHHLPLRRAPLARDRLLMRLARHHLGYHRRLARRLARLRDRHGAALLVDLHSMPAIPGHGSLPDIVISDAEQTSCGPAIRDAIADFFRAHGLEVAINTPFAGGYTIRRHAAPGRGVHAVQIECARPGYLTADGRPHAGFFALMRLYDAFWAWLAAHSDALFGTARDVGVGRLAAE